MNETLFKHAEKKWKPRNKQAALITRRASPLLLHTAPVETVKAPTLAERLEADRKILRQKIENAERENKERLERRAAERAKLVKPPKAQVWKYMWAAKFLKRLHKSKGLPPPTTEQIRRYRMSQPNYGKPL